MFPKWPTWSTWATMRPRPAWDSAIRPCWGSGPGGSGRCAAPVAGETRGLHLRDGASPGRRLAAALSPRPVEPPGLLGHDTAAAGLPVGEAEALEPRLVDVPVGLEAHADPRRESRESDRALPLEQDPHRLPLRRV